MIGGFDDAVDALRAGRVVVMPTDTVYGIGADPFLPGATQKIFDAKRRPRDVELPVLIADPAQLDGLVATPLPAKAVALADRFWPGPLTLVLDRDPACTADLGVNPGTVGVRCPDHDLVRALCRAVGPLAVTSANRHGEPTPPTAAEIDALFGDAVAVVLDGGRCEGAPSTVVRVTAAGEVTVLREGRIPADQLTG